MTTEQLPPKDNVNAGEVSPVLRKKPYQPPQLTTYGHISKLTMTGSGGFADGASMRRTKCL